MSQISKCPKVTVILSYWEASGEVSKLRYESLLYSSSKRSYCIAIPPLQNKPLMHCPVPSAHPVAPQVNPDMHEMR